MLVKYSSMVRWHLANQPVTSISLIEHVQCCTETLNSVKWINRQAPQVYLCIPFRPSNNLMKSIRSWLSGTIDAREEHDVIVVRIARRTIHSGIEVCVSCNKMKMRHSRRETEQETEKYREENNININRKIRRRRRGEENANAYASFTSSTKSSSGCLRVFSF